jgi:predicted nucleic acid-binding protein
VKYLLDTTEAVYYLRGEPGVAEELQSRSDEGLAASIISVAELYEGVFRSRNVEAAESAVKDFLDQVAVLGIDEGIARIFGQERATLGQRGIRMSDLDLLIAATAIFHGLTLLTSDRDFARVENLSAIIR